MNIVLIVPRYPFEKDQIYLSVSITAVAAQLMAMDHVVDVVDLNIDRLESCEVHGLLRKSDFVGISLTGSAHIPGTLNLIPKLQKCAPNASILLGGQVVRGLSPNQFTRLFGKFGRVVQCSKREDLARALGGDKNSVPPLANVSFIPVWLKMGEERMVLYLKREGAIAESQGCKFNCAFCAAQKGEDEEFLRSRENFAADLRYLVASAKRHGLPKLEFYATSLDFFQNPLTVQEYLIILATIREETGMDIRVRCLSCQVSFLNANEKIPNLKDLLRKAGLWCIGFGGDGADKNVWKMERKQHNTVAREIECVEICEVMGIRAEILMVFGFPEDSFRTLAKAVATSLWAIIMWDHVIIRPYLAKPFVPGNKGWITDQAAVEQVLGSPRLFYNLDFCAIGSRLTHPRFFHRWMCNTAYLFVCAVLTPFGKCTTSPLLPQGGRGIRGWLASIVNRWIPFDR